MPQQIPAGLVEACQPFLAMRHAWSLQATVQNTAGGGVGRDTLLRNAMPFPTFPTVGQVQDLLQILESVYGPLPLKEPGK